MKICIRLILYCLGFYWLHIKGQKQPKAVAPIMVSNHISFIEPIVLLYETMASPVAAFENLNIPFLGAIVGVLQSVLVNRDDPKSRLSVVDRMKVRRQAAPILSHQGYQGC